MSNENKIRILYVQPGKYPEERFVVDELPSPSATCRRVYASRIPVVKGQCGAYLQ